MYARFSPDRRRIAYLHQEAGQDSLWVVNIDGSGRRQVSAEENDTAPDQFYWSPDGKSLACTLEDWQRDEKGTQTLDPENAHPRVTIVDVEGKPPRALNLPTARWLGAPDWR